MEEKFEVVLYHVEKQEYPLVGVTTRIDHAGQFKTNAPLETIRQALAILKPDAYEIYGTDEHGFISHLKSQRIEASEIILKQEEIDKQRRNDNDKRMESLAKAFREAPKVLATFAFGKAKIQLEKGGTGIYNPQWSSTRLQDGYILPKLYINGKVEDENFWLSNFITQDKRIQKKKLIEKWNHKIDEPTLQQIADKLLEIKTKLEETQRQYGVGK